MNARERFLAIAKGDLKDEVFLPCDLNYDWFMKETIERWQGEGLPAGADPVEFFDLDRVEFIDGQPYGFVPAFAPEIIAEDQDTRTVRDEQGITKRIHKTHEDSTMPQWLDFPVRSRQDFRDLQRRLDPLTPARYPADLDTHRRRWQQRDHPLGIGPGSFYGHTLQRWVGPENLCVLFYDDPRFVHEMLEYLEQFFLGLLKQLLPGVRFDFASFGEDIAFKGRSFISPRMFREFIQPRYRSICELLRANGVEVIFVDSDGYIDELIPLWLEVGINGFSPLEVAAGSDALALKRKYGRDIILAGNIDKRALARGRSSLDREIRRAKALLAQGGYFPAVDHSVPPDIALEDFRRFVRALREA